MKITLNTGSLATTDLKEPFVLPDTFEIEIVSPIYKLDTLVLSARNGQAREQVKLSQKPFKTVLKDTIRGGRLELEISNVVAGEITKTWRIPDVILKEVEHTFEAIPEIEELKREISTIKKGMAEILKLI